MVRSSSRKNLKKQDTTEKKDESPLRDLDDGEIKANSKKFETHMDQDLEKLSEISQEKPDEGSEFMDNS
jgi:hypothetical protein